MIPTIVDKWLFELHRSGDRWQSCDICTGLEEGGSLVVLRTGDRWHGGLVKNRTGDRWLPVGIKDWRKVAVLWYIYWKQVASCCLVKHRTGDRWPSCGIQEPETRGGIVIHRTGDRWLLLWHK